MIAVKRVLIVVCVLISFPALSSATEKSPKPLVTGLKNPTAVCVGSGGRLFISEAGEEGKDGDGRVLIVNEAGKAVPFATGLDHPNAMVAWTSQLIVADNKKVWRIDSKGTATVIADEKTFPVMPTRLMGVALDGNGILVSDTGAMDGGGAVYRVGQRKALPLAGSAKSQAI